ncbi:MAG TPA: prolyl oligopeptidase family serine peptidase [Candidatus Eremiobacteraceae bacterium]|jgi:dipeptidyl aminopeptidase/acylaminoacyl peptidase
MHVLLAALFSLSQGLSFPMPLALVSGQKGQSIAYVLDKSGVRSLWYAEAPAYAPRELWNSGTDDGQELTNLAISNDGKYVVYVRGGSHDANWVIRPWPNPALSPSEQRMAVMSVATAGGEPKMLGEGDTPVISPDGATVAFVHDPDSAVWSAPIDGKSAASLLFFDRGQDGDLQYAPVGSALVFTSNRNDHSFIGVYRDQTAPLQFLAPSTSQDFSPRWSPDGSRIAFIRIPGAGGPPQDLLKEQVQPWAIWVANVADARGHEVWHSGNSSRDSLPGINGPQLNWVAGGNLVFISEQSNWPNLYEVHAGGGSARALSPGSFMVEDTSISPDLSTVYYSANAGTTPGDIARRHIFRVSATGGSETPFTSGVDSQWWPAATADGAAYVNAGAREPFTIAHNGRKLNADQIPSDFPSADMVDPKLVSFTSSDGMHLQGTLFAPAGGAAKKPAVIFVHGGPPRQMLLTWHYFDYYDYGYGTNQYLASRGYVVLSVNYRLGIGYGHDFQYPAHAGPRGAAEYNDILAAARYLQHDPAVDPHRIGIYGGSYGGYLTAMALAKNSNIFTVGVDTHGVHDWSMGENEVPTPPKRYQQPNTQAYLREAWLSSPDAYISTWRSPVLLMQGDDDRNVEFQQMVDLVQRLRLAHVPYEEKVIPNEIHGFLRWHSWLEVDQSAADFLTRYLRP